MRALIDDDQQVSKAAAGLRLLIALSPDAGHFLLVCWPISITSGGIQMNQSTFHSHFHSEPFRETTIEWTRLTSIQVDDDDVKQVVQRSSQPSSQIT